MSIALRILLSPLAPFWWLYAVAKRWTYNAGLCKSYKSSLTTMVVGNLSMGGTGKTPFSIYLIQKIIDNELEPAYLSRGYGRDTKGLKKVQIDSKPTEVGDESLMVKLRFPQIDVIVCENRKVGLKYLEKSSMCRVVVMDDAFQHLKVCATHYFLLSTYGKPYFKDFIFPIGDLREPRVFAKKADSIVITKCPNAMIDEKMDVYAQFTELRSTIVYADNIKPMYDDAHFMPLKTIRAIVFSGIAEASIFYSKVEELFTALKFIEFKDHHNYTKLDLERVVADYYGACTTTGNTGLIIITTEKDAARLQTNEAKKLFAKLPLYYWPIQMKANFELDQEVERIIEKKC